QVVQGDVEIVAGEDVAQVGHAGAGVLGVTAVRVALGDDLEVVVRLLRGGQVATARVEAPYLLQEYGVAARIHQSAQVVHVRGVAVGRVGAQEAVDAADRVVLLARL